jgi:hypothetical protein
MAKLESECWHNNKGTLAIVHKWGLVDAVEEMEERLVDIVPLADNILAEIRRNGFQWVPLLDIEMDT